MSEQHDDRLQVEAAQRDPSRFADLYRQNFYRVYTYVVCRVGDRHQAEDLTADVFREALAGIRKFEWRGVPFAAWLLGIAARVLADHWKRSGREAGTPAPESGAAAPAEIEQSAMLFQLVHTLPTDQRRVVVGCGEDYAQSGIPLPPGRIVRTGRTQLVRRRQRTTQQPLCHR